MNTLASSTVGVLPDHMAATLLDLKAFTSPVLLSVAGVSLG